MTVTLNPYQMSRKRRVLSVYSVPSPFRGVPAWFLTRGGIIRDYLSFLWIQFDILEKSLFPKAQKPVRDTKLIKAIKVVKVVKFVRDSG